MKRLLCVFATTALLLAATGCGEQTETSRLTLIGTFTGVFQSDVGRRGSSPGDARAFSMRLATPSGQPAGRLDGTVVITDEDRAGRERREYRVGNVQFSLARGNVVIGGVYLSTPGSPVPAQEGTVRPIVGGTGAYRGARGEVTQRALPGGRIENVLDIDTPAR